MSSRKYFYMDESGNIKRYSYCSMCGSGPYKETQKNYDFISLGTTHNFTYCLRCIKTLGISNDDIYTKYIHVEKNIKDICFVNEGDNIAIKEIKDCKKEKQENLLKENKILPDEKIESKNPSIPVQIEEDRKGVFYVYMGQYIDGSFSTGVTEDLIKEIDKINSGSTHKIKKLPLELLYYHIENSYIQAIETKTRLRKMDYKQKETLIKNFLIDFFK